MNPFVDQYVEYSAYTIGGKSVTGVVRDVTHNKVYVEFDHEHYPREYSLDYFQNSGYFSQVVLTPVNQPQSPARLTVSEQNRDLAIQNRIHELENSVRSLTEALNGLKHLVG